MKIAITGSRGFIGGSVARFAAAQGHEVLGISRSSQPEADWPGRHLHADALHADLAPALRAFQPDVFLHAAGTASVAESLADPLEDLRASTLTLANTLDSIRRAGISPTILFPSSAAVYGNPAELPVNENAPVAPISPYGFHKAACELLAREYAECFGLKIIVCRLFSVFGERQRRLLVWEIFKQLAKHSRELELQGTGEETRDFLHVEDVSSALLRLAKRTDANFTIVNVASGHEVSVRNLAEQMRTILSPQKTVRYRGETRAGDPLHWRADVTRLHKITAPWQSRDLTAALRATISDWQHA